MSNSALPVPAFRVYNLKNILMLFCLYGLGLGLVPPAQAADPGVPAPAMTTTVKASPGDGKLVRRLVVRRSGGTAAATTPLPAEIDSLVQTTAQRHAVDPLLVQSVMKVESNFNPEAVSPKGAMGLMQLMPATARRFGAADAFDARQNIEAGVKYLKFLKQTFQDDRLALAAYNAGEGAVMRHGGVPPYRETQEYVEKVRRRYSDALARKQPAPAPVVATQAEPLRSVELVTDEQGRIHMRTRN